MSDSYTLFIPRRFLSVLLAGAYALSVSACSTPPSPTYDLSAAKEPMGTQRGHLRGQLLVYEPGAIAVYDSDRIVVKGTSQGLTYLPNAQWADRLPKLVQTRLIQTFENANRFKSVGRPGDRIVAATVLTTEIRSFQIDEQTRQALVEISAKRISQGSGQIETAMLFQATAPVASIDAAGASKSLDEALQSVLIQIVNWAAK